MSNTADTYNEAQDKRVNGPRGYKTSVRTPFNSEAGRFLITEKTFWRAATSFAPAFHFTVTYHR